MVADPISGRSSGQVASSNNRHGRAMLYYRIGGRHRPAVVRRRGGRSHARASLDVIRRRPGSNLHTAHWAPAYAGATTVVSRSYASLDGQQSSRGRRHRVTAPLSTDPRIETWF